MPRIERASRGLLVGVVGAVVLAAAVSRPAAAVADPQPAPGGAQRAAPATGGDLLTVGRQRFNRACGRCHPGGREDIGPSLLGKNWAEDRMTRQIRRGGGRMRPINPNKLPNADLPALMAYLRSIHAVR